ncbi:MAG: type II toxin-antitoxin system VapC family toxin [Gammaproteobacteria bacterium]|nr:type II toxin-antitoxin system VapC family toxin [Gammaproteobacteria bacterium]MYE52607.1 type II toxin-antitoxin system VapC family toxin [Gammaproteobacteria bacterium]MYH16674.1 type II toxin-antitoxin system VapC family toxin [Gammaproteobacteria bacterium]MYK84346.1 type II toxin-antitoxin system VapC family toxin [Gammaproteobacteria bacterium]
MVPKVGDVVFIDTNVLLTATEESRPNHEAAHRLIAESDRSGMHLAVSGQILREYMVVATRPVDVNGLGLNPRDAIGNVEAFLGFLRLYDETEAVADKLRRLGQKHGLQGKRFHDANIVATMSVHGIRVLVSDNFKDFAVFDDIDAVALSDAVAASHREPKRPSA